MNKQHLKILLVNPETPNTFWSMKTVMPFISKKAHQPPPGLLTVAAMLPESFERRLIEQNVSVLQDEDLRWADYLFIAERDWTTRRWRAWWPARVARSL